MSDGHHWDPWIHMLNIWQRTLPLFGHLIFDPDSASEMYLCLPRSFLNVVLFKGYWITGSHFFKRTTCSNTFCAAEISRLFRWDLGVFHGLSHWHDDEKFPIELLDSHFWQTTPGGAIAKKLSYAMACPIDQHIGKSKSWIPGAPDSMGFSYLFDLRTRQKFHIRICEQAWHHHCLWNHVASIELLNSIMTASLQEAPCFYHWFSAGPMISQRRSPESVCACAAKGLNVSKTARFCRNETYDTRLYSHVDTHTHVYIYIYTRIHIHA